MDKSSSHGVALRDIEREFTIRVLNRMRTANCRMATAVRWEDDTPYRGEAPQDLAVPEVGGSPAPLPPARPGSDIWAEGVAAGLGERRRPTHTVEREIILELQDTIRVLEARIAVLGVTVNGFQAAVNREKARP